MWTDSFGVRLHFLTPRPRLPFHAPAESLKILEVIPIPLIFRDSLKCGELQHRHCDFGKVLAVPALPGTGVTV
jgi:hypothetical protein